MAATTVDAVGEHVMEWFARCIRGLEGIATAEIEGRLHAIVTSTRHREVRFTGTPSRAALVDLRTVDDVFFLVGVIDGIGHTRAALDRMRQALRQLDWRVPSMIGVGATDGPAQTFDVVASFLGRRNFSRFEVEDTVGEVVASETGALHLSRRPEQKVAASMTYRLHIEDDELVVGIRVAPEPLHRREYKQRSGPASLHPPVAAAMALLSGLRPEVTVFDPFCGSGTIAIESARWLPSVRVIGSDISIDAVDNARHNATGLDRVSLLVADAARLPYRDHHLDRVVTNPPWGVQAEFTVRPGTAEKSAGSAPNATPATDPSSPGSPFSSALNQPLEHIVTDLMSAAGVSVVLIEGDTVVDRVVDAVDPQVVVPISLFGRHPRIVVRRSAGGPPDGLLSDALPFADLGGGMGSQHASRA